LIELATKVIDKLIQLKQISDKRLQFRYNEIYKPSMVDLEKVHKNYLIMLYSVESRLDKVVRSAESSTPVIEECIATLKRDRLEFLSLRVKLSNLNHSIHEFLENDRGLAKEETLLLYIIENYFKLTEFKSDRYSSYSTHLLEILERRLKLNQKDFEDMLYEINEQMELAKSIPNYLENVAPKYLEQFNDSPKTFEDFLVRKNEEILEVCSSTRFRFEKVWEEANGAFHKLKMLVSSSVS